MKKHSLSGKWDLYYCNDEKYRGLSFNGIKEGLNALSKISGSVPGNFELDFEREGILPELFYSRNILAVRKYEDLHLFYYRTFDAEYKNADLIFEGIDTFADIYLNGVLIHSCQSMLVEQKIENLKLKETDNELLVHIRPAILEGQKMPAPEYCFFPEQCVDGAYVRKAAHTYGWDIMPRAVSGGIWKDVYFVEHKDIKIDGFSYGCRLDENIAKVTFTVENRLVEGIEGVCKIRGKCKDSIFEGSAIVKNGKSEIVVNIENAYLWWPKDYGEANLYELQIELIVNGETVDVVEKKIGVRTTQLVRTSCADWNEGEFYFVINGQRVYIRGTNWVPMDAFHSRDKQRIPMAFSLLEECNCNCVRLWGGNVYEDELLFQLCDENGIMIWFDFSMACGLYPQDEYFQRLIEKEAEIVVKKYQNYSSIILWSGDNECDINTIFVKKDPNQMVITRKTLKNVIERLDSSRPYLPSSPYMDEEVIRTKKQASEDHNWGDRADYRGPSFTENKAKFLSEIGFGGMVGRTSLEKFIAPDQLWPWWDSEEFEGFDYENLPELDRLCKQKPKDDWLYHSGSLRKSYSPYSYRIPVLAKASREIFGDENDTLDDFIQKSQIVQAEAYKFIVERRRMRKHNDGGVLWWNLLDGWPQISEAVVDYYYTRKLAFYYLKASQQPVTVVMDCESRQGNDIYLINDSQKEVCLQICIRDITQENVVVFEGRFTAPANTSVKIGNVSTTDKFSFYQIVWDGDYVGYNHFVEYEKQMDLKTYKKALALSFYKDHVEEVFN